MTETVPPPSEEDVAVPPKWARDNKASAEVEKFDNEDALKGIQEANSIRWLKVYGWIVPCLMITFSALYGATLLIYAFHFLTTWGWLSPIQLDKIQSLIFSGSVGAFVASVILKHPSK